MTAGTRCDSRHAQASDSRHALMLTAADSAHDSYALSLPRRRLVAWGPLAVPSQLGAAPHCASSGMAWLCNLATPRAASDSSHHAHRGSGLMRPPAARTATHYSLQPCTHQPWVPEPAAQLWPAALNSIPGASLARRPREPRTALGHRAAPWNCPAAQAGRHTAMPRLMHCTGTAAWR